MDPTGLFNEPLEKHLASLTLPEDALVLHYVDDVLIAAASKEICPLATRTVLHRLASCGYKGPWKGEKTVYASIYCLDKYLCLSPMLMLIMNVHICFLDMEKSHGAPALPTSEWYASRQTSGKNVGWLLHLLTHNYVT